MWRLHLIAFCALALSHPLGTGGAFVEDKEFWMSAGKSELDEALNVALNTKTARNVIMFVGSGMGPNTVTAARIYTQGESGLLTFEKFPHMGLLKTYSANKLVPDAASSATAMFTGVKVNQRTLGLDATYTHNEITHCSKSNSRDFGLESLATWAQAAGKNTGFVTNARITDATPAALYARTSNRKWECNSNIPSSFSHCKDIARQLIENEPGRNFKVIMGGGKKSFDGDSLSRTKRNSKYSDLDKNMCVRSDGKNLTHDWIRDKASKQLPYAYLENAKDLHSLDTENTEYVLGLFADGWMPMEYKRRKEKLNTPTLELMTKKALKVISKNEKGYFLMVESSLIDVAHHSSKARLALDETAEFDKAINTTIELLKEWKMLDDTLVIVTSDHANLLSINGYPDRGKSIFDVAAVSQIDDVKYTALTYSVGFSQIPIYKRLGSYVIRQDPLVSKIFSHEYSQQVGIRENTGVHGGSDVAVHAKGPMAHLFHSTHEQNYIAHAVAYAAKIGPYQEGMSNESYIHISNIFLICTLILTLLYF